MDHGAVLDSVTKRDRTAVECAIDGDKKKNVEYLLNLGAPIGKNSLFVAAKYRSVNILTILVNHGAALDGVDKDGDTVVECALLGGRKENAEYLLNLSAPLGKTALACAVFSADYSDEYSHETQGEEILALVRLVMSKDPAIIDEKRNGRTAREFAVACGYQSVVELLDSGAR